MRHLAVLACLLLAGCAREAPAPPPQAAPPPVATEPSLPPRVAPAPPAAPAMRAPDDVTDALPPARGMDLPTPTIAASSADASRIDDTIPVVRALRIGGHNERDRLVFEFAGQGLPAWKIEYVARPLTDCGGADTVATTGEAWLQVRFIGARAHDESGHPTSGPARRVANLPVLREVVRTCDFEGEATWVASLARPAAYTPRTLEDPARLVVDIAR